MTLVVGAKCKDGIVLGSDGAATFGAMGQRTARQPTRKLTTIDNRVIVASSGPMGLGQRLRGEIEAIWNGGKLAEQSPHDAMTAIRIALWTKHLAIEFQVASVANKVIGNLAVDSTLSATLAAMPLKSGCCLFHFDQQGAPEMIPDDLPFVAIGSGQLIADPFLGFLRRVLWNDKVISVSDGLCAVLWTLRHTIETNPGGVSNPTQVVVLAKENGEWIAREVGREEQGEHEQHIKSMENMLVKHREEFLGLGDSTKETPLPPPAPPEDA